MPPPALKNSLLVRRFKIWNSAIGLETAVVKDPDGPILEVGREEARVGGLEDQTLRSAFAVSCVPAFQNLARNIGRNISSGIDVFWLPNPPDRKTLLVTPIEQAEMIAQSW